MNVYTRLEICPNCLQRDCMRAVSRVYHCGAIPAGHCQHCGGQCMRVRAGGVQCTWPIDRSRRVVNIPHGHSVIIPPAPKVPTDKMTAGERLQIATTVGIAIVAGVLLGAMLAATYLHR